MEINENRKKLKEAIKEVMQILDIPLAEVMLMINLSKISDEKIEKSIAVIKKYF